MPSNFFFKEYIVKELHLRDLSGHFGSNKSVLLVKDLYF
jgi:hypothetical protein